MQKEESRKQKAEPGKRNRLLKAFLFTLATCNGSESSLETEKDMLTISSKRELYWLVACSLKREAVF
jgi:hypothetical protein